MITIYKKIIIFVLIFMPLLVMSQSEITTWWFSYDQLKRLKSTDRNYTYKYAPNGAMFTEKCDCDTTWGNYNDYIMVYRHERFNDNHIECIIFDINESVSKYPITDTIPGISLFIQDWDIPEVVWKKTLKLYNGISTTKYLIEVEVKQDKCLTCPKVFKWVFCKPEDIQLFIARQVKN